MAYATLITFSPHPDVQYLDQDLLTIVLLSSGHELLKKLMVFLLRMKHLVHITGPKIL
jgi:hypothetical protein